MYNSRKSYKVISMVFGVQQMTARAIIKNEENIERC